MFWSRFVVLAGSLGYVFVLERCRLAYAVKGMLRLWEVANILMLSTAVRRIKRFSDKKLIGDMCLKHFRHIEGSTLGFPAKLLVFGLYRKLREG